MPSRWEPSNSSSHVCRQRGPVTSIDLLQLLNGSCQECEGLSSWCLTPKSRKAPNCHIGGM